MDKNSYFFNSLEKIKNREQNEFKLIEQKSTDSIVAKIVEAVESNRPKFRYVAPWWQGVFVQISRISGK